MKFQFEPDLDFQLEAIQAVCDIFRGQESCRNEFTVTSHSAVGGQLGFDQNEHSVGNYLSLSDEALLENVREIQLQNRLPISTSLESRDFTVEMETGTGKTYVYLRTIFELNQKFGFTKFVIVVPSVAIKEGVNKSLEMMGDHFRALYSGTPFEHFVYDSAKLGQVRNFAASRQIQIMVMTVGAINKKNVNSIYHENEDTGGAKPIDLIRHTNPILIVDEPQSVDGGLGGRGKEAIDAMNHLCTLRYSATHADTHHMVYRLNAVDAYERQLVKQIEVAAATIDDHNQPYVRFLSARRQRGVISAQVEVDVQTAAGAMRRRQITVTDGDDLEQKTNREIYRGQFIGEIRWAEQLLELRVPGHESWLNAGEAQGDVDNLAVQTQMIFRTIREHLAKEQRLSGSGIKVLSLFFIDRVAKYRDYDEEGNEVKGEYARIFERQYQRAATDPNYRSLFIGKDVGAEAEKAHGGYFSIDRRSNRFTDTADNNQVNRDSAERAYNLIMRDKEKLLSFDEPLKFIFSHSALREGWDNPNVFQICTLREIQTERARRQSIGRGLRLCVNQDGGRIPGFEVNTLTVIANESYEEFADNLQQEIQQDTGIRFGIVEPHQFASIPVADEDGQPKYLGMYLARLLYDFLMVQGYIGTDGGVEDSLRRALSTGTVDLPDEFEPTRDAVVEVLHKAAGRIQVQNADERRRANPREAVLHGEAFKALWDRIRDKTTYRVQFDEEKLVDDCTKALGALPPMRKPSLTWHTASLQIGQSGVGTDLLAESDPIPLAAESIDLPDVLTELQNRTQLTRRSIQRILIGSGRLADFSVNPQRFIETAAKTIIHIKQLALVDGIQYHRLGGDAYYAQDLFEREKPSGYLRNMLEVQRSIYDYVKYDSAIEAEFARRLELNESVKVYVKLPSWFTVPTPLGTYNPDWAVVIDKHDEDRLYFVAETKASSALQGLRDTERAKVKCGQAHFEALKVHESPAEYRVVSTLDELLA